MNCDCKKTDCEDCQPCDVSQEESCVGFSETSTFDKIIGEDNAGCKRALNNFGGIILFDKSGKIFYKDGSTGQNICLPNMFVISQAGQPLSGLLAMDANGCWIGWTQDTGVSESQIPVASGGDIEWQTLRSLWENNIPSNCGVFVKNANGTLQFVNGNANEYLRINSAGQYVFGSIPTATPLPGQVVQSTYSEYTSSTTTTSQMNTSPPTTSQGVEILTASITPVDASNLIRVRANFFGASGTQSRVMTGALFRDSGTDAVQVSTSAFITDSSISRRFLTGMILHQGASSGSQIDFAVRVGLNGTGTCYINSNANGQPYGAITKSTIIVEEIQV